VSARGGEVRVRDAASVVLLRDGVDGLETWLLTRVSQMIFAAGMSVFPGGRVDEADAELPFAGPVHGLAERFGCPEPLARALLGAGVRETFEETGTLLITSAVDLLPARAQVEAGQLSFGDLLRTHDLTIDPDVLAPWAHWVTPVGEVRRYDTRFFLAELPPGAVAADVTSESSQAEWVPVARALAEAERGERDMLPPTVASLRALLPFATAAEAIAASEGRDLTPVQPRLVRLSDGRPAVELPDGSTAAISASMLER
jgi:8-oxo-dGTP pyrophosphatase MutT (NUDIX family)